MRESEEGFTLIGLLIAVAILGILATIAVPKFTAAVTTANTAKVQADLSTLDTAIATARIETGRDPTKISDLTDYVEDIDNLKPPKGKVYIQGKATDVSATVYGISKSSDGKEPRATLDSHTAAEFTKQAGSATTDTK